MSGHAAAGRARSRRKTHLALLAVGAGLLTAGLVVPFVGDDSVRGLEDQLA